MVQWRVLGTVLTKEAWMFWLFISCPIIALWVSFTTPELENKILYAGTCFQLGGIATVAWGIHRLRKEFGTSNSEGDSKSWKTKFINALGEPQAVQHVPDKPIAFGSEGPDDFVTKRNPDLEVTDRVIALEDAFIKHQHEQRQDFKSLKEDIKAVKELVREESNARNLANAKLTSSIRDHAVGGIRVEWIGLIWLFFGTVGTSIPKVIADWIHDGLSWLCRLSC